MARVCIALLLSVFLFGCSQQARRDSARLDLLLSSQKIDTVDFVSPYMTNTVTGAEAQKLVRSLNRTNRVSASDWSKGQVQHVCLRGGTNEVCWLSLFDSGTWAFGEYDFRLRQ